MKVVSRCNASARGPSERPYVAFCGSLRIYPAGTLLCFLWPIKCLDAFAGVSHLSANGCLVPLYCRIQVASLDALKAEEATQKSKLEQKLAARRTKKMQELKLQEESEIKKKEERDAQKLEVR